MWYVVLTLILILFASPKANAWSLIRLDEASANYNKYLSPSYGSLFPQVEKDGLAVNVKSTVLSYFFWDSQVHGTSDDGQYRSVGLFMSVGLKLSPQVDLSINHHSQHVLDTPEYYNQHFPSENWVQLTVYFYRSDRKESVIP